MVGPNGVPARPWLVWILEKMKKTGLMLILKKTGLVSFWWRAWYAH